MEKRMRRQIPERGRGKNAGRGLEPKRNWDLLFCSPRPGPMADGMERDGSEKRRKELERE